MKMARKKRRIDVTDIMIIIFMSLFLLVLIATFAIFAILGYASFVMLSFQLLQPNLISFQYIIATIFAIGMTVIYAIMLKLEITLIKEMYRELRR